ncbi:MAG: hypothetical protein NTW82_05895 [Bacteroidia bacterium]|nr:hypothetical protein [Bacteroidia bacterium]
MKNIASNSKYFFLLFFLLTALNTALFPQGTESRKRAGGQMNKLCMTIYLNPSMTKVSSGEIAGLSELSTSGGKSLHGALDLDYFFSRAAGISFGIGYSGFSSQLSLVSWSDNYSTKDSENESYVMTINGSSIVENNKIGYIHIPVGLSLRFPAEGKIGFCLQGGIGFDIPLVKSYDGSGKFSYSGYYATYNVTLSDIPVYFPSNVPTTATGDLELKPFSLSVNASGSVFVSLSKKMQVLIGGHYNRALSNILSSGPDPNFMISSKADEMNSLLEGSSGASVQAIGLSLGLRYFLK